MSLSIKKKAIKKAISVMTMIMTVTVMSNVGFLNTSLVMADVVDGALIKSNATNSDGSPTLSSLDVYIVKIVGTKQFKRLVLNPTVFDSYGHLNWGDIQTVSQSVMDGYTTSALVRVDTDPDEKVYAMAPENDTGKKSWVNVTAAEFLGVAGSEDGDSIYTINSTDAGSYVAVGNVTTVAQLETFYSAGTLPEGIAGDLDVALSATTPASTTVISTQAAADFLSFNLTGTGTVTGVSLKRTGISADASLSNVYLYDGATRLTDAASVSSGGVINFTNVSGLFDVSGSRTISVKADLTATAGETIAIQLTGITLSAGAVNGLPVSGNTMSVATATLAGASFGAVTPTGTPTINPANDIVVWQSTLTITNRDVNLTRMALREIGSINYADVNNFRLYVNGVQIAQTQNLDTNGYVTFSLDTPEAITTGSRVVKVVADVIGGSSRTLSFSLRNKADIGLIDSNYGVGTSLTSTVPATAGTMTVASGSLTVAKTTDSPSGNITLNGSDETLAKYTFTAFGEAVKVETLTAGFVYTNTGAGYIAPVVATTTFTVSALPINAETITIGSCVVTFVHDVAGMAADDELDCSDSLASIDLELDTGAADGADRTIAQVSAVIDTLTSVTDVTQGALTVGADTATTTLFTAPAALTGSITSTDGTSGDVTDVDVAGVTQVGTPNTAATLRNGRIMVDGAQVGSTTTLAPAGTAFTTNFVVTPGSPATVEIRSDVYDNDLTGVLNASDTILASLLLGASNGQGQVSSTTVNVPTANQAANTVTVATGSVSLSKQTNYANQNTVVPQTAYKLAVYNLTGNSTEDVNIDTISIDFTAGDQFTVSKLTSVYLMYDGVRETNTKATVNATGNTWSVSHVLEKNTSVVVEVYVDIATMTIAGSNDSMIATTTASGTTVSSAQAATTSAVAGQTITAENGSIAVALDASSPVATNVDDNQTLSVAAYKFTTVNDKYTISEVVITPAATSSIANVVLKDGVTVLGTMPAAAAVTFGGLGVVVNANSTKVLTVEFQLGTVGPGAGTSAEDVAATLTSYKHTNSVGTLTSATPGTAGNATYVFKSIPTITNVTLPSGTLATGTVTLAKVTVNSSGSGTIGWKKIIFSSTKTANPTIANGTASTSVWDADTNTQIAGVSTAAGLGAGAGSGTVTFVATNEQEISGAKTYVLKATIGGSVASTDSITTSIGTGSIAAHAKTNYAAVAATAATFVWTDQSVSPHDAVATSADWNNNYLVRNVPTDTQRLAY